jgi:predicted GNAT superfamily acetyltransferase
MRVPARVPPQKQGVKEWRLAVSEKFAGACVEIYRAIDAKYQNPQRTYVVVKRQNGDDN